MNIVLLESLGVPDELLNACAKPLTEAGHTFKAYPKNTDPKVQIEQAKDADVIMIANMPLKGEVISACPNLKFIDVAFTGVDHVDLDCCRERGITVSNCAGYSTVAVADLVFGLVLSLARNIPQCDGAVRRSGTKNGLVGFELEGKTFGVVGLGAIGSRVAAIAGAFGCRVLGYNRSKKDLPGVEQVDLNTLLEQSDIVSLHVPATPETHHLIDASHIARMKTTALLINTARGGVVDSAALADALNAGRLAGAGIDVFETEPPSTRTTPCSPPSMCWPPPTPPSPRPNPGRSGRRWSART